MTKGQCKPASAAFGVRLGFVLQLIKNPKPKSPRPAGNIAGEASGNKIT